MQTGCPAYFRLKLIQSGVALQIVALNIKHNHPLEPPKDGVFLLSNTFYPETRYLKFQEILSGGKKGRKPKISKTKADKRLKDEIKSEDESESDNNQVIIKQVFN